ncbi:MAG: tRNA pseudouridine(38-40) synthase TruA [Chloroflexi bacterium]|nr:MAG: tRNA pseudouridine(38-40) synthase TruA [Chloroflexota bacterium]
MLGERVEVVGAGRTDAGVHASGQVISFRSGTRLPEATIERGVNALLPADVAVSEVSEVDDGFHARFSATGRTYNYMIWNGPRPRPLLRRTAWWVPEPLDLTVLRRAATALIGTRDFSSFAMKGVGSRERTVRSATWTDRDGVLVFDIAADGFLRGMVRGIVGTQVRAGRRKIEPEAFEAIVAAADRDRGGPSAPAHGLCLVAVSYAGERYDRRPSRGGDEEDE